MPSPHDVEQLLAEDSARALLAALEAAAGGEATPAELRECTGLAPATVTKWLGRLRAGGLVAGPKPRPHLTAEGWAAAGRPAVAPSASLQLGEAIARWPTEHHRAFLRLALSAVIARWHLGARRGEGHAGFIAGGATGTGKTSMARFVAEVFGLDWALARVQLRTATAGEVLGRLERDEGGAWAFRPSPLLGTPFVVFDEFDKAEPGLQRDALVCFQGDVRVAREGQTFDVRAVPMLTCNVQRQLPVPPEYRRRSVVLDTDPLAPLVVDLDLRLRELYDAGGPPRLALTELVPPASQLPTDAFALLRSTLQRGLTADGFRLCEPRALELAALGAGGGVRDVDLAQLALQTAVDYLTCAETAGETRPAWRAGLAALAQDLGAGGRDAYAALERGEYEQRQLETSRRRQLAARSEESLALTGERQAFAEQLHLARPDVRQVPREHRPEAKRLQAQLERLRRQVLDAKSADALEELRELAERPLGDVDRLRGRLEAERQAAAAAVEDEQRRRREATAREREQRAAERAGAQAAKAQAAAAAQQARDVRAQQRQRARQELAAVREGARQLERLWQRRGTGPERPLDVLPRLRVFGQPLLVFEPYGAESPGEGRAAKVLGVLATMSGQGAWRSPHDPGVSFSGSRTGASGLEEWGPSTQRVLAAPLARLHSREDELLPSAGVKPRQARARAAA